MDQDPGGPVGGTAGYAITSQWPGGRIIRITYAQHTNWEAHITYTAPVTASVWSGTATVDGHTIVFTPGQYNFGVDGQLTGDGYADPSLSYVLVDGQQVPFSNMPEPPSSSLDTYYIDPAEYLPTPELALGQLDLPNVWDSGPFSMMLPNERNHWAMACAHAGQLFRNVTGVEDPYTDGNHYLATAIQESRMGADSESDLFTYPHPAGWPITFQPAAVSRWLPTDRGSSRRLGLYGSAEALSQSLRPHQPCRCGEW